MKKQAGDPPFFIAFLKCSKHNYQLDQVLENFKYAFYFDGITLKELCHGFFVHFSGLTKLFSC